MEFGSRALGARSIIANPNDEAVIQKINDQVKRRDFGCLLHLVYCRQE